MEGMNIVARLALSVASMLFISSMLAWPVASSLIEANASRTEQTDASVAACARYVLDICVPPLD
jgi:hypothetical protein